MFPSRTRFGLRRLFTILVIGACSVAALPCQAQVTLDRSIETAPIVLDGEVLFSMRGISSYPATQRAQDITGRIRALANDESFSPSDLRVVESANRTDILAGELRVMSITDADAAAEDSVNHRWPAERCKMVIARAIERYRLERSSTYLWTQAAHAGGAVVVLAVLLMFFRWFFRRLAAAFERRAQARLARLEAKSYRMLSAESLKHAILNSARAFHWLLSFALVFVCLSFVLELFPWTRAAAHAGAALLIDPLRAMGNGIVAALPGLVFIAILIVITRYVMKIAAVFFAGIAEGKIKPAGFDQNWAWPTFRLTRLAIIAFAVVVAYPYVPGSGSDAFKGVTLFLGLLMSLGASSMVANSLAGYTLVYRRAFKVGDRIQVGEVVGDVVAIRQQVTHLKTPKNEEVTIPSSMILGSHVTNYSSLARERGLILHTTVGIGYETPWRQVEAMLLEAAARTPGLLREPPPFVHQKLLGDFCITYEINVYCDQPQEMQKFYTALHQSILDVFNEYGVQIMTPAYEGDPEAPKIVPKEQWFAPPARSGEEKTAARGQVAPPQASRPSDAKG